MRESLNLQTFKNQSTEVFVTTESGTTVTVNVWNNLDGASIMVHGKDLNLRMAGAFRWDEIDVIIAALSVARTA